MKAVQKFLVNPNVPERLRPLMEIAYNLWWVWNPDAIALFQRIDRDVWEQAEGNPIKMLGLVRQDTFVRLLSDDGFLSHLDRVHQDLRRYMEYATWYDKVHGKGLGSQIAYFSLEFGIHECLPIYSGGLGVLSGDHLKSTSELGLPVTGIGLLYRFGYFKQYLNRDGWQQEAFPVNDYYHMPVTAVLDKDSQPLTVQIEFPERAVTARLWRIQVGRVPLYMLDTNIDANLPQDREITSNLYGGDLDMRIRQEILLGIGGLRALNKLGTPPTVCHMNEGHSAFLALERIRLLREKEGLSFDEAREVVGATTVFTTHTPVPAGNDMFPPELMESYFRRYVEHLGLSMQQFLGLGRQDPNDAREPFCMTVLALKLAAFANGVSELHGKVSRRMWKRIWPGIPEPEIPITHVTNGVHTRSWYSDEIERLLDRYVGPEWLADPVNQSVWKRIENIPDSELWRSRERLRERLVAFARRKLREQFARRGIHRSLISQVDEVLDPEVLTVGFARRFATYKRAALLMHNPDRLNKILNHPDRPMQIIFAGKAHPKDHPGKELIRTIVHMTNREEFRRRVVFLEDYNMQIARTLIQGVDVWLNTPRRPMEASGTSGMKVAVNGGINLSMLDGWWCEGYQLHNGHSTGWAIGGGEEYDDHSYQDDIESRNLYDLIENEVAQTFYRRGPDGLPREWIGMMKTSMQRLCPVFNTNRMVEEYTERFYLPAILQWNWLAAESWSETRKLAEWRRKVAASWKEIRITALGSDQGAHHLVGDKLRVQAHVHLGSLTDDDVNVELFYGPLTPEGEIVNAATATLLPAGTTPNGQTVFEGSVQCASTGHHGFTVRVLPYHRGLIDKFSMGLVTWLEEPFQRLGLGLFKAQPARRPVTGKV
ncbi:MAG TPA: alpha-glucan phosphorylase [Planctomycetes bacterium]|nr:alpha-glucan phosphorylase [Planctomycetota bacterium]